MLWGEISKAQVTRKSKGYRTDNSYESGRDTKCCCREMKAGMRPSRTRVIEVEERVLAKRARQAARVVRMPPSSASVYSSARVALSLSAITR